jgi:hypothetical protein
MSRGLDEPSPGLKPSDIKYLTNALQSIAGAGDADIDGRIEPGIESRDLRGVMERTRFKLTMDGNYSGAGPS